MNLFRAHYKAFALSILFAILVALITIYIYTSLNQWRAEVIQTNQVLSELLARQLQQSVEADLALIGKNIFSESKIILLNESQALDSVLKIHSEEIFKTVKGTEGGFFFSAFDEFSGYAYPTSPPPKPAFGPPPRSYAIIKKQALETIESKQAIIRLHQFDPAIFPLATEPIIWENQVVGAAWARIHIERELPAIKLRQVINIGAIISLLGFVTAVFLSVRLHRKIQDLKRDLQKIHSSPNHRLRSRRGILGFISLSINDMLKNLQEENKRRQMLENQLHQKEKMASLGKLIAGVAHEVKTPLAIIKTRIQIWQRELRIQNAEVVNAPAIMDDSMQLVVNETDRLTGLVKRLLIFARPIANKMLPTDINQLVKKTIAFLGSNPENKKITFETAFAANLPNVNADQNALEQVLLNIIVNATEAVDEDGCIRISTAFSKSKETVTIQITDNGCGISDDVQEKIFDPFFTTKSHGAGLGLSISYEIIKAHGGSIRHCRAQPRGAAFTISLPLA